MMLRKSAVDEVYDILDKVIRLSDLNGQEREVVLAKIFAEYSYGDLHTFYRHLSESRRLKLYQLIMDNRDEAEMYVKRLQERSW